MKRFILLLLVFIPITTARAQVTVIAAGVVEALQGSDFERGLKWLEEFDRWTDQVDHFKKQVEDMEKKWKAQMQNLGNINKVHNYEDFMNWFNR
jgi:hypothetical protein